MRRAFFLVIGLLFCTSFSFSFTMPWEKDVRRFYPVISISHKSGNLDSVYYISRYLPPEYYHQMSPRFVPSYYHQMRPYYEGCLNEDYLVEDECYKDNYLLCDSENMLFTVTFESTLVKKGNPPKRRKNVAVAIYAEKADVSQRGGVSYTSKKYDEEGKRDIYYFDIPYSSASASMSFYIEPKNEGFVEFSIAIFEDDDGINELKSTNFIEFYDKAIVRRLMK